MVPRGMEKLTVDRLYVQNLFLMVGLCRMVKAADGGWSSSIDAATVPDDNVLRGVETARKLVDAATGDARTSVLVL